MKARTKRPRWQDEDRDGICDRCRVMIDDCRCVCPFCGETTRCECVIGPMQATGGD